MFFSTIHLTCNPTLCAIQADSNFQQTLPTYIQQHAKGTLWVQEQFRVNGGGSIPTTPNWNQFSTKI